MATMKDERLAAQAQRVAKITEALIDTLIADDRVPIEAILAGIHGQVITEMLSIYGPEVAADRLRAASEMMARLSALEKHDLAASMPMGTA